MKIPVEYLKEGDSVIAYSPALDLSSCGATLAEAKKNFREAVDLWVESCLEMGTLDTALLELGWKRMGVHNKIKYSPPRVLERTEEPICIPA